MDDDLTTVRWAKSSYSQQGGNCVEWAPAYAFTTGVVPVRDSACPNSPALAISAAAFSAFVERLKGEEFGTA
ncbi:DUF397 domain-containing protein [Streptomyces sp. NPDC055078]